MDILETLKEHVEFEQSLQENSSDIVMRKEYLIPDTHPDVDKILITDVRINILNKEVLHNKVLINGDVDFVVVYKSKDDGDVTLHSLNYSDKFSGGIDVAGTDSNSRVDAESYLEHVDCNVVNERKISINGVIKLRAKLNKKYSYEIIKDVEYNEDIQTLRSPRKIDRIVDIVNDSISLNSEFSIDNDMPELDEILKYDIMINRKDIKVYDEKIEVNMNLRLNILYKNAESGEINCMEEEVYLEKEINFNGSNNDLRFDMDYAFRNFDIFVNENELGENRNIGVDGYVDVTLKIYQKESFDMIEDIYSTNRPLKVVKDEFDLNVVHGNVEQNVNVRESIEVPKGTPKPHNIIMTSGEVFITDKKNLEDKVLIDGVVRVSVIYRSTDLEELYSSVNDEIPFSETLDIPGARIDMSSSVKSNLENISADIEGNVIVVNADVGLGLTISHIDRSNFIVDIVEDEEFEQLKKHSITIYIIQPNDTLWKVAKRYCTNVDNIAKLNSLDEEEELKAGDKLLIPGKMII